MPLKALAQPDDKEQLQTPAEGDSGSMTVDYTVLRIVGDQAFVQPTAVNGTSLDEEAAETPGDPDEAEGAALRDLAQQQQP